MHFPSGEYCGGYGGGLPLHRFGDEWCPRQLGCKVPYGLEYGYPRVGGLGGFIGLYCHRGASLLVVHLSMISNAIRWCLSAGSVNRGHNLLHVWHCHIRMPSYTPCISIPIFRRSDPQEQGVTTHRRNQQPMGSWTAFRFVTVCNCGDGLDGCVEGFYDGARLVFGEVFRAVEVVESGEGGDVLASFVSA